MAAVLRISTPDAPKKSGVDLFYVANLFANAATKSASAKHHRNNRAVGVVLALAALWLDVVLNVEVEPSD